MPFLSQSLINEIAQKFGVSETDIKFQIVGGGSINRTAKLIIKNKDEYFIKINQASKFPDLFLKEKKGLQLLQQQNIFKVPKVIDQFILNNEQLLILEWINSGTKNKNFWKKFGEQLAALHSVSNTSFGSDEDNYMGSVFQKNSYCKDWNAFFIEQRLQPMIELCSSKQLLTSKHHLKLENLYKHIPNICNTEKPSLLHGDLWSGNFMCDEEGNPVLIDPAVYFGHRSIDLGMTTLFGGFDKSFYEAYQYHYSLPKNYNEQWQVSNLYPLLIHLYLFGTSYLHSIESVLNTYG